MTLITSAFYSLAIYFYYQIFFVWAVAFLAFFVLDSVFWGALAYRVPDGGLLFSLLHSFFRYLRSCRISLLGWVAIVASLIVIAFMLIWVIGEHYVKKYVNSSFPDSPFDYR